MVATHIIAGCFAALSGMAQVVHAQSAIYPGRLLDSFNTNFTFTDCAAPGEMQSCWSVQNLTQDQDDSATCTGLESRIDCVLTNCWNRVYSCDYQQLMITYNYSCGYDYDTETGEETSIIHDLPFFPPPDDVSGEGECSCNLPNYFNSFSRILEENLNCSYTQSSSNDDEDDDDTYNLPCSCCQYGAGAAMMHNMCPDTDPYLLFLDTYESYVTESNGTVSECPSELSNFTCPNNGFGSDGQNASAWAQPTLPTSATGQLTDAPGIITSPISGATFTWTGINSTYTITAASTAAQATKTAASSTSGTSGKSGTSGTSSASPTSSSGAASRSGQEHTSFVALAAFAGFAFAVIQ